MKMYHGGEKVATGVYWSLSTGEFFQTPTGGEELPGKRETHYIKAPLSLVMAAGPLLGLIYMIFLPFVGIGGFFLYLANLTAKLFIRSAQSVAETAVPSWVPGVSYLVKEKRGKAKAEKKEELPEELEGLLKDIDEDIRKRRDQGEK